MALPESESLALGQVIRKLLRVSRIARDSRVDAEIQAVVTDLQQLQERALKGYHRNPPAFRAGMVMGKIGDDIHAIRYRHAKNGHFYQHQFNGEAEVWGVVRNGKRELLLTHRRGEPLWDEFPDDRE